MDFKEYQKLSRKTAIYPDQGNNFVYPVLGLLGESGEVAETVKRIIRGDRAFTDKELKEDILKELGDVLWYLAQVAEEFNLSLEEVAENNIEKLRSRKERGVLRGQGNNR
jgi:NTP pyrophosphatase (non-canonical NTP hydrolase)